MSEVDTSITEMLNGEHKPAIFLKTGKEFLSVEILCENNNCLNIRHRTFNQWQKVIIRKADIDYIGFPVR